MIRSASITRLPRGLDENPVLTPLWRGLCLAGLFHAGILAAQNAERNLGDLSIEELMNESVTSVSKKAIRLSQAPTAITVITPDDIRALGFTSFAETLRLVPGLQVARVNANIWSVSSRGFNNQYANKLLVLMDGRSLYTPLFGGVYWDVQDMVMEDLDRIEVIRGPGSTLWGANAVNGVINITSKHSKDTQGTLLSTSVGTFDQPGVSVRHGGILAPGLTYRAYIKSFDREGLIDPDGNATADDWNALRGGFRTDWEPTADDLFTVQADLYHVQTHENLQIPQLTPPFSTVVDTVNNNHGFNVLGRWTHTVSADSHWSVQSYFDHFRHSGGLTVEQRSTFDLELEHRFALARNHDVIWGAGYRHTRDELNNTPLVIWTPTGRRLDLFTAFVQDEITVVPEKFGVTLGSKIEHNTFTGFEYQPSLRLRWTPNETHTVWAAVSRSVSTPGRFYRDGRLNTPGFQPSPDSPVIVPALIGDPDSRSEVQTAFEAGYRVEPAANLSFDLAVHYNLYDRVHGTVAGEPWFEVDPAPPHLVLPLDWQNNISGESYGAEVTAQWKPTDRWRLTANYTWLKLDLQPQDFSLQADPRHQASLRSYLTLPHEWELNGAVYYVDSVKGQFGTTTTDIPSYVRLDLGVTWRPTPAFEIGLWGHNLLDPGHFESTAINTPLQTEIPRSVQLRLTWRH